ncbi:hypothetical protein PWEIH_08511 [Listeria weihenstephanensis FSL R9-0317]|uniref:Uncharacterized protein n=1 Tax=Listeria weihenstephanensis TaxID=1006155 RepID=A0A1S7FQE9_9LIST|nr:hypothetical protein [Listeria weihenstephanensis]AQY49617.1 hypothetical protein UE46_00075 [Listeria weihenstephanensis]EUJ39061.1 hypothetical protein PWEIH_08511 [Listeria weihenstephanensis FSL R9-0317]
MKKKMKKVGAIICLLVISITLLIPIQGEADWQSFRYLGNRDGGVQGMNYWYNNQRGYEYFVAGTTVDRVSWSSNNTEWTKANARYGSSYGEGSSYTKSFVGNTYGSVVNVSVSYNYKPKGFLGAFSEHSRNDKETAWRELVGYWGTGKMVVMP